MRTWWTWLAFGGCLAIVLGAMGWISLAALRADAAEVEARAIARFEENVRLALSHLDSLATPLAMHEGSRPYFWYSAYYPADRPYSLMFSAVVPGERLAPSPLLTESSPHLLLHFRLDPEGGLASPQAPAGELRKLAVQGNLRESDLDAANRKLARLRAQLDGARLFAQLPRNPPAPTSLPPLEVAWSAELPPQDAPAFSNNDPDQERFAQKAKNNVEDLRRSRAFNYSVQQQSSQGFRNARQTPQRESAAPLPVVHEGPVTPLWQGEALLLARRVSVDGCDYVQGAWLDWDSLREWLLSEIRDLLPDAALEPALAGEASAGQRLLAALPVRLLAGAAPASPASGPGAVTVTLAVAWSCVLCAAFAVGLLLAGVLQLSERRAAFVSAVTHELRTPLTTLRMYAEMLAERMVPDESRRQEYLHTLRAEADRLMHLVENVLAYARLERGRAGRPEERLSIGELLTAACERLSQRAEQAGLKLVCEVRPAAVTANVRVNPSAVEQILFNLVDNACKYAAAGEPRVIELTAGAGEGEVHVRVRDHGPGLAPGSQRRWFRPFRKSAQEAAHSKPGVGLGLALSQRLARQMGGRLRHDATVTDGAAFELTLPVVSGAV